MDKIKFRVYDKEGHDVTDKNDWYIDVDGNLYFETNDINKHKAFGEYISRCFFSATKWRNGLWIIVDLQSQQSWKTDIHIIKYMIT